MSSRKKKQTYSQQLAGMATIGLPQPVRAVATSRTGSRLLLILVPVLLATGVLTISFSGGMPTFSINRERAEELKQEVTVQAKQAATQALARFQRYEPLPRR